MVGGLSQRTVPVFILFSLFLGVIDPCYPDTSFANLRIVFDQIMMNPHATCLLLTRLDPPTPAHRFV